MLLYASKGCQISMKCLCHLSNVPLHQIEADPEQIAVVTLATAPRPSRTEIEARTSCRPWCLPAVGLSPGGGLVGREYRAMKGISTPSCKFGDRSHGTGLCITERLRYLCSAATELNSTQRPVTSTNASWKHRFQSNRDTFSACI